MRLKLFGLIFGRDYSSETIKVLRRIQTRNIIKSLNEHRM